MAVVCPVCAGALTSDVPPVYSLDGKTWKRRHCPTCRHAVLTDEPQFEEAYVDSYYTHSAATTEGSDVVLRLARRAAPPPARLLDVGSGNGQRLVRAAMLGYRCEGFDVDEGAARIARGQGAAVSVANDLDEAGLPSGAFDIVTANHVAEHTPRPLGLLATIFGLLAPGGHVVVAVPNASSLPARLFGGAWTSHDPPRHLQFFSPRSLRKTMSLAGFVDVKMAGRAFVWPRSHQQCIERVLAERRIPLRRLRAAAAIGVYPVMAACGLLQQAVPSTRLWAVSTALVVVARRP